MIKWFKSMFSGSEIVNAGIRATDALVFTDEERSDFMLQYVKATLPMAIARRFIAMVVTMLWAFGVLFTGALLFTDHKKFEAMAEFMGSTVMPPFTAIMVFYFMAHVVSRGKT